MSEISNGAKAVRVNGMPLRVPLLELTDPNRDPPPGGCNAQEPPEWGGAVCTLDPHGDDIWHIAHDGDHDVIAIWHGEPLPADEMATGREASQAMS
jgi:hypothetical protein